ncbi:MAG TPA: hypothetical protein VES19_04220 [Candidatus Limnocylindrales bacterium]|nr:hypothetical protein [Candidatus Limnocylindrales bacterium]
MDDGTGMGMARWRWIIVPLLIGVASRLFSTALIVGVNAVRAVPAPDPFRIWDGGWYLRIAATGYHADPARYGPSGLPQHDYAFYPAWPAMLRAASEPFGSPSLVGALLANLLFLLAAVLMWRVFHDRIGPRSASLGVALVAFAPPAFVFSLPYTESLFLALAAASLLARRSAWRGPLGAAAMLTRVAGGALVVAAAVEAVLARGAERRAAVAAVIGGGAALVGWVLFVGAISGDPLAAATASSKWVHDGGVAQVLFAATHPTLRRAAWVVLYALVVAGAMLLWRRDRELAVYSLVALVLPMLPGGGLPSMPRYALVAFPAFAMLADRLGRRAGLVLLGAFIAGQVLFARWVVGGSIQP